MKKPREINFIVKETFQSGDEKKRAEALQKIMDDYIRRRLTAKYNGFYDK